MLSPDIVRRIKEFLSARSMAYRRVFNAQNRDAKVVLEDLSRFCRAAKSTAHVDPHMAARLDGRREVWLRLQDHLNLSTEEMYRLYHGQKDPGQ